MESINTAAPCAECSTQLSPIPKFELMSDLGGYTWDQRKTLRPPPFKGPMARMLRGLSVGDPRVDAMPTSAVCCHGQETRRIGLEPHPAWVDWESVRRGQRAFLASVGQSYAALTFALLQGFSIARFAEVLFHNGYAQSGETAFERYRETSFAILDWMNHPLDEKDSKAQLQLQNVRAMHSFARRRSKKLFDESLGEGIALSQYDMAEVLLAFAGVAPDLLTNEFGVPVKREDKRDMCHAWRLIGYHLGIMDEFNPCNSLEDMEAVMEEWMTYVPLRFKTCRPATFELQRTALEGLGKYTGAGVEFLSGTLHASCETRDWGIDLDYLERACLPGMKSVGHVALKGIGKPWVGTLLNANILRMRQTYLDHPKRARMVLPWLAAMAKFHDTITWPLVGYTVVALAQEWKRRVLGFVLGFILASRLRQFVQSRLRIVM